MLMWSFNRDGEMAIGMLQDRDRAMGIDSKDKRHDRQDLAEVAHPQRGVDDLNGSFPNAEPIPPPGVRDVASHVGDAGGGAEQR